MIKIYTDGACSHNGTWNGGWATVIVAANGEYESYGGHEKETTNNRMELQAFLKALQLASKIEESVEVITDSAYIVNAFEMNWIDGWLRRGWKNSKKKPVANRDLWEQIIAAKGRNVFITKVKGHNGDKYNEIADKLAVEWRDKV